MIRFSAALVAVAIGVLIGGIATSKLLLVYIAIVVSAVALLALAIGVVVKREELFGEGQGLVPAGAGATPALPARAGESQDQPSPAASVPSSAPFHGPATDYGTVLGSTVFDGTAFGGPAFGATTQAAPVTAPSAAVAPPAADRSAPHQAPAGPGRDRVADPAPSWEAQSARDQWSSSPWPGGSTTADPAPDWIQSGRGTGDPAAAAGTTAPSSPTSPAPLAPSGLSGTGWDPATPNWFAPQARSAEAVPPATETPADADLANEDDDWPTRYSWLDDEADENPDEADTPGARTAADADETGDHPVSEAAQSVGSTQDPARDTAPDDAPPPATPVGDTRASDTQASDFPADVTVASETVAGDAAAEGTPTGDAVAGDTLAGDTLAGDTLAGDTAAGATLAGDPASVEAATSVTTDAEPGPVEPESGSASGESASAAQDGPAPAAGMVAVLRGVPRYHQPDCVLIRFLPEADIQRLSPTQARADGCTPCAACQPVG